MAVDPKNPAEPTISVFVSQLCEELRALKARINFLESQTVRAPGTEVLTALPNATARMNKLLSFDAAGNAVATAPATGDVSEFALEIAARLKRDGSQAMLGELALSGNAVNALGAVPKQQAESISSAAVEQLRGTDLRIAKLPPTTYFDSTYSAMLAQLADGRLIGWGRMVASNVGSGNAHDGDTRPVFSQFAPRIPTGVTISGFVIGSADSFVWLSNGWVYHAGVNVRGVGGHGDTARRNMFTRVNFFFAAGLSVAEVTMDCHRPDDQFSSALFRCTSGDLYFTGYSVDGGAGDGQVGTRNLLLPVKVLTVAGAVGAASGGDPLSGRHAWNSAGQCWAWGNDYVGHLGLGAPATTHTPAMVPGILVQKVVSRISMNVVSERYGHSLFLLKAGTVKSAGMNLYGELGNGTTANSNVPVNVNTLTNIVDIGIGGGGIGWSWAVTAGKELWQWGANTHGALGIGNIVNQSSPVQPIGWIDEAEVETTTGAPPFQGKVVKVITGKCVSGSVGAQNTVVLDEDGNVWSAGYNHTAAIGWNLVGSTWRFKRAALMGVAPGDKIVDIHYQGHASNGAGMRLFALTAQGRLLMSGTNNYALGTAMTATGAHGFVFLQPVKLGV